MENKNYRVNIINVDFLFRYEEDFCEQLIDGIEFFLGFIFLDIGIVYIDIDKFCFLNDVEEY